MSRFVGKDKAGVPVLLVDLIRDVDGELDEVHQMTPMTTAETLVTAEQFLEARDGGLITELVRGQVIEMNPPGFRHGRICARIVYLLSEYLEGNDIGRVTANDAGVITERDPDTVRGPDVAFYSYRRLPKEDEPQGYPDAKPELVFEVLSPGNRWPDVYGKIGEYLNVGVSVVCVVDPDEEKLHVFQTDTAAMELNPDEAMTLPDVLPGLQLPVKQFFA